MRAALVRVDVVGERVDRLLVRRIPLHRDLDLALLVLAFEIRDALVDRVLRSVDVRNEVSDPALVVELDLLAAGTLVGQDDPQAAGEKGRLAQPLLQRFGRELELLEDLRIGQERDRRARVALLRLTDDRQICVGRAPSEFLAINLFVASNFRDQPLGEGVHDGDADAVQAARDLVRRTVGAELSAGVQLG